MILRYKIHHRYLRKCRRLDIERSITVAAFTGSVKHIVNLEYTKKAQQTLHMQPEPMQNKRISGSVVVSAERAYEYHLPRVYLLTIV